jgi:hypothetical protein
MFFVLFLLDDRTIWIRIWEAQKHMDPTVSDYFLKVHLHHFSKIKVIKKSQNSRNHCFSYYFCLIEGSESGRPKNIWILTDPITF